MKIMDSIFAERLRQINTKGFTVEHDDELVYGELAYAAAAYAVPETTMGTELWPFDEPIKRDTDLRRNLVKAAALIIAEIERLDKLEVRKCS